MTSTPLIQGGLWRCVVRDVPASVRGLGAGAGADVRGLLEALSGASEEFAHLWALQEVVARRSNRKVVLHPQVGRLEPGCDVVLSTPTGQRPVLFRPQPGTATAQRLDVLRVVGTQDLAPATARRRGNRRTRR